jgi:hypothetical protein
MPSRRCRQPVRQVEQHFIRGIAKMTTRVGLAIAVMMAMALGHVQQGRPEQMRSLVQPIPATG